MREKKTEVQIAIVILDMVDISVKEADNPKRVTYCFFFLKKKKRKKKEKIDLPVDYTKAAW